jgi:L-alanine-DL-glutamate epimerase-like enolase superfamily enzyme
MAKITAIETWVCRKPSGVKAGGLPDLYGAFGDEVVVIRLTTDEGGTGVATAFAACGTTIPLAFVNEVIAPVLLGRDVTDREAIWQELFVLNRRFAFFPMYLPGPVDVALWDLAAKDAGLPLFRYLGAYRSSVPAYASSQFMPNTEDYLTEIARYRALGVNAYKIHPSGGPRQHMEIAEAVRAAQPDAVLMLDPALSDYTLTDAVKVGRKLESLDFHWLEEPFHDPFVGKYAELSRTLDISVCATEASYGGPAGVAEFLRAGAVDIVRADVSWKWGVTGTMKTLHLAEAFGINCELHTTLMGPMDLANLHVACAAKNSEYFELFAPHEEWQFPLISPIPLDGNGHVHAPEAPGLGIDIDWDAVDDSTHSFVGATA